MRSTSVHTEIDTNDYGIGAPSNFIPISITKDAAAKSAVLDTVASRSAVRCRRVNQPVNTVSIIFS